MAFIFTIWAIIYAIVNLLDPDLATIMAVKPVNPISKFVILLFVGTIFTVFFTVVDQMERNLYTIATDKGHRAT